MIYEVREDLLKSDSDIIAHGCNCFCTMGAGVAKAIVNRYPEALLVDKKTRKGDPNKLGRFSVAQTADGKLVYNLYTQFKYGRGKRHADYDAIRNALRGMRLDIKKRFKDKPSIGMPRIGAGLAGGDWNLIKKIIQDEIDMLDPTIYYL